MVIFVPSWTDRVVNWVSRSELNEGEGGKLEFLCLPGGTLGRSVRNNGGGEVVAHPETDPRLVVLCNGQRVVGRLDVLNTVGSVHLLRFVGGGIWLFFSPPKRTTPDEFIVGLSLLHIVVKGVQIIERDRSGLGKVCALRLMDKSVGYNQTPCGCGRRAPLQTVPPRISCLGMRLRPFLIENAVGTISRWE